MPKNLQNDQLSVGVERLTMFNQSPVVMVGVS